MNTLNSNKCGLLTVKPPSPKKQRVSVLPATMEGSTPRTQRTSKQRRMKHCSGKAKNRRGEMLECLSLSVNNVVQCIRECRPEREGPSAWNVNGFFFVGAQVVLPLTTLTDPFLWWLYIPVPWWLLNTVIKCNYLTQGWSRGSKKKCRLSG